MHGDSGGGDVCTQVWESVCVGGLTWQIGVFILATASSIQISNYT